MRGMGRLFGRLGRRPESLFGCLVFFLGGFSLALWPLPVLGPTLTLITLLTIVAGLVSAWRDIEWFRRVWVGGLLLAAAAALIALMHPVSPRGLLFQAVALIALLPAGLALIRSIIRQWQPGMSDRRAPAIAGAPPDQLIAPEAPGAAELPPPLPRRKPQPVGNKADTELPPPLSRRLTPRNELPPPLTGRDGGGNHELLAQLLSVPPERKYGD